MKKINAFIALLLVGNLLFADILELASPGLSASLPYYESQTSSVNAISNPALTSDIQRYTFDFNYMLLTDITESEYGHSINLGGVLPSKYGVFSTSADLLLTSGLTSSDLSVGTGGHININFSKKIYSDLSFGAGITTILGTDESGFDWGLGLNLGFVREQGNLNDFFKDFRWGVSLNNMGKGYKNSDDFFNSPAPVFTPEIFGKFNLLSSENISVDIATDLTFPSVTNMDMGLGAKVNFLNNFIFDTSLNVDIKEMIDGNFERLIPSVYLGYKLNLGEDEAKINISANPYASGVWAFAVAGTIPIGQKDKNPPEVNVDYPKVIHISPNLDGTKDELTLPITVEDERYIAAYELVIKDSLGRVVKTIKNKEERPENESLSNLYERLISPKTGVPVPESFRWDGRNDGGEIVSDGNYFFTFTFSDDNGNTTRTEKYNFIVDNTNPTIDITKPTGLDLIFSPNGDGNKDTFVINQNSSLEERWYAEITDFVGSVVKTFSWDNSGAGKVEWDGKDLTGQLVPDGVYQYRVLSTDLAGNSVEDIVDNIIINTKQPPIGITISTNTFSPNGDEVKDYMEFLLDIPVKTGIIKWDLIIKNKSGREVNRFSTDKQGYSVIEDRLRYNGDDSSGTALKEGTYLGELSVVYQNGHSPKVTSPEFVIDVTPPIANVTPQYTMFSPDGDGNKDVIKFNQNSSMEEAWIGEIFDEFGNRLYVTEWKGEIDKNYIWNGKSQDGELQDDGMFTYVLKSTDRSGNSYTGTPTPFELNTTKTEITLLTDKEAFSPLNPTRFVDITPEVDAEVAVNNYHLTIIDSSGRNIKTLSRNENLIGSFKWDGSDDSGSRVRDSEYFGKITAEFENGNRVESLTTAITLDTVNPTADISIVDKFNIFSPNGDGLKDSITIRQNSSNELTWTGEITNSVGDVVSSSIWSGVAPKEYVFSGKDLENSTLPDGTYNYKLYAVDSAGNRGESKSLQMKIDTEDVELFVTTNHSHFSPNGDRVKDTIEFRPQIKKLDGIESIFYEVFDKENSYYTLNRNSDFESPVTWNAKSSAGRDVKDGEYSVKLTVNYQRGDSPVASSLFKIDRVAPKAEIVVENSVFSPNGDGNKDEVLITNNSSDEVNWTLDILNSNRESVKSSSVTGELTKSWNFDGRGEDNSILDNGRYYYSLKGVDKAGNEFVSKEYPITLDNSSSAVVLTNNYDVFSPNGDGIKDVLQFTTRIEAESPVDSWTVMVKNSKGETVESFSGARVPKEISWRPSETISDGKYYGVLEVIHENGNNPVSKTPEFISDSTYPRIDLSSRNELFSPNGDNLKDEVLFKQSGSGEELYHAYITDASNNMVNEWYWKDRLADFNWNGKDTDGNIVEDGRYKYFVETTDLGGNRTVRSVENIEVDTTETDIFITYKKPVFAPDLVETRGPQTFGLIVNNRVGIDNWSIAISNRNNKVVDIITGGDTVPDMIEWDGKDESGNFVNGEVKAKFNVIYKKGNSPEYSTKYFVSDSEAPLVNVVTGPTPFSPDDDFVDDELTIDLGVKDMSEIEGWKFRITDPKGNEFITFSGLGKPGKKIIWDGRSSNGELVQAAEEYQYIMSVTDVAGHTGFSKGEIPVDILVIKEGDKLKIKISSIIFEPNSAVLALTGKNGESNKKILNRLSEILDKYSSYNIVVEGHANNIYGPQMSNRQRNSLIEFSNERAIEVMKNLSELGIAKSRMSTVGIGGDDPVVGFGDVENAWKNRRVEFVLIK